MGLQVTAANKRKHDTTFEGKHVNPYTTSSPPIKACKWSIKNNNYMDALEKNNDKNPIMKGKFLKDKQADHSKYTTTNNVKTKAADKSTKKKTSPLAINSKSCLDENLNTDTTMNKEVTKPAKKINCFTTLISITTATSTVAETITTTTTRTSSNAVSLLQLKPDVSETRPLSPSSNTLMSEDSITKLEEVASAALPERWSSTAVTLEPVDCISKLQAVAVPTDPWGRVETRSTLASTLLNSDELDDDDDDDFEDDYDEEEGIIPTYCSLRYNSFSSTGGSAITRSNGYVPSSSYGVTRPNYYSEPFPLQNCARTNSSTHVRVLGHTGNSFPWPNMNQYYMMSESANTLQENAQQSPQQQQTIRCAENGKSYLELGCSNSLNSSEILPVAQMLHHQSALRSPTSCGFLPMSATTHGSLKRCCEARSGIWCGGTTTSNKSCYKDIRMKIRNLSMFKLSRFRQVSEQSLYRSVLICNTLKRIDREIEAEAKEIQAANAAAAAHAHAAAVQHHCTSYNHNSTSSTAAHHQRSSPAHHHMQQHHLQQPQQIPQQHPQDYTPVMNCARLSPHVDFQGSLQQQNHMKQLEQHYQQQYLTQNLNSSEHLAIANATGDEYLDTSMQQKSARILLHNNNNGNNSNDTNNASNDENNRNHCDTTTKATITTTTTNSNNIDQNNHYPCTDSQSGRATPYPSQFVTVSIALSTSSITQSETLSPLILSITQANSIATPSTIQSSATNTKTTKPSISSNNSTILVLDSLESMSNSINTIQPTVTAKVEFVEDLQTTRLSSINWSSVLSLSSQSALDPLNSSDLFAILPPATNPAVAIPVPVSSVSVLSTAASNRISFTSTNVAAKSSSTSLNCSTSATFTTLSTISSATHSLTSSYVNGMNASSNSSTWEYGFLDMDFGLGTEFTELLPPTCKMNSDDLFKNALTPVSTSRYSSVHENELEQPAHIMVGS